MTLSEKYELLFETAYQMRHYQLLFEKFRSKEDGIKAIYYKNKLDQVLNNETRERKLKG